MNKLEKIQAYHYSSKVIEIGEIIKSEQHLFRTFPLILKNYIALVPDMPTVFGYAYPIRKDTMSNRQCYLVETEEYFIGNFNYSVYYTMDALTSQEFSFNKTIPLKTRLQQRETWLKDQAYRYFNYIDDVNQNEIISPSFKVIEKLS